MTFGSESPNLKSAWILRVGRPVLGHCKDPDENSAEREKVLIISAITRRIHAFPRGDGFLELCKNDHVMDPLIRVQITRIYCCVATLPKRSGNA